MSLNRRQIIAALGLAGTGGVPVAAASTQETAVPKTEAEILKNLNLIEMWIIPHGGDCCGCAMSENVGEDEYRIVCNECGQELDVLVGEIAFRRMGEALMHARHALVGSAGLIAHDGKPEHAFRLDFGPEIRAIDEALRLADIGPRLLQPLPREPEKT